MNRRTKKPADQQIDKERTQILFKARVVGQDREGQKTKAGRCSVQTPHLSKEILP